MDDHEKAYHDKFNETMDTESRVNALEAKVAELRRQTDLTYQVNLKKTLPVRCCEYQMNRKTSILIKFSATSSIWSC